MAEPRYRVEKTTCSNTERRPITVIEANEAETVVNFLAERGYYGGNPTVIWAAPADHVISAYYYKLFVSDYQSEYYEINKEK